MMNSKDHKVIYRDSTLSSFVTGAVIGATAALMLGTKDGRKLTQKLQKSLSKLAQDFKPQIDELAQKASETVSTIKTRTQGLTPLPPELRPPSVTDRLHRTGPSFTQKGKPLS
jgi:uncharacterized membrane protein YebE (DUF533 family)